MEGAQLPLAELHKVLVIQLFKPIQLIPQGGSPSQTVHFPTQFAVIGKFHQRTFDPSRLLMKSTEPYIDPWGTPLLTGHQLEKELYTTIL